MELRDTTEATDVVVVGGGNAGLAAAHAAAQRGRRTIVLERGPRQKPGGNSFYTAGATRIPHGGLDDLKSFVEPDERHARTVVPPYSQEDFVADMEKVTQGRNDPHMTRVLASESRSAIEWLAGLGMRYRLMYERQAYERDDGSYLFWGGLHVGNVGGGQGLIADHLRIAERLGEEVRYDAYVTELLYDGDKVYGVRYETDGQVHELRAESVIIAAGSFESNAAMREAHLGSHWTDAKLRGTPNNTGDLIEAALALGAAKGGDWSTCHSVQWDAFFSENESNSELTNRLTRQSYPIGIVVDRDGKRFLDEGADFRNYTYARYGQEVLARPGAVSWQVFDATTRPLLRAEEYEMPGISIVTASTIEELAERAGIDTEAFAQTVNEFNKSVDRDQPFDPTVKDGRAARTTPPKSNWAQPIEIPPFYAYAVTCGITFTFGGLRGDLDGRVLREDGGVIEGLLTCGESLGGLFSGNYPGGSGLAAGTVFGRRAGSVA